MKRKNFKLDAVGYIVYCKGASSYPTALQIVEVRLVEHATFYGYVARDKDDNIYIIQDSGEIFDTREEAVEYLRELCETARKEYEA